MLATSSQRAVAPARKKTTEACDPCRTRKLKCDGLFPCKSCENTKIQCCYDPSTAANKLNGGLDIINARVLELERAVFGERTYRTGTDTRELGDADISEEITSRSMIVCFDEDDPSAQSVYGPTSTLMLLKGMHPLPPPAAVDEVSRERPHKRLRYEHPESELDSSLADKIYEAGETYDTRDLDFRGTLAKKHLDSFFDTVHGIYPIFDENSFRGSYPPFEHDSFRMAQDVESRRLQCLMYSVLSLGALYMNTTEDAKWAAKYFGEAEKLVSSLFGKTSVQAVQACMFMAIYAHQVAQSNLAYNYLGVAIRLAYSAGINDMRAPRPNTLRNECALRTWWSLYSLESDICLEYGRPLCIRETDAKAPYPKEDIAQNATSSKSSYIIVMAKFGRLIRKVIDLVSNISERKSGLHHFVGRLMNQQAELMTWRGELPAHLAPRDTMNNGDARSWVGVPWVQRQRCEIQLRFNHVMLIMHRPFFLDPKFSTPFYSSAMAKGVCLGAARETISLADNIFATDTLRKNQWSPFYHRVMAATLIVLVSLSDEACEENASLLRFCSRSLDALRRLEPSCPKKGIAFIEALLAHHQINI